MTALPTPQPTSATGILLRILTTPDLPGTGAAGAEARIAAGESLARVVATLDDGTCTAAAAGLAAIVRGSTSSLHKVRAAVALLLLGVDELPPAPPAPEAP